MGKCEKAAARVWGRTFIPGGPEIPQEILEAQEDGKLVFFCGSGISYKAGLKGFKGLVKDLYKTAGIESRLCDKQDIVGKDFEQKNYDRVLGALEEEWSDFREKLDAWGKAIDEAELSNHESLIQLAVTSGQKIRLVTTNFDTAFVKTCEQNGYKYEIDHAPKLPVAKDYKWNSIVHLHGLSGKNPKDIVITSADFGAAYITERWAARFVTDLFSEFTVLFIGYSLEDPILRYLTDAIAADKRMAAKKENTVYAFDGYDEEQSLEGIQKQWKAKHVKLIPYDSRDKHHLLHKTLEKWADEYSSGEKGLRQICARHLPNPPIEGDLDTQRIEYAFLTRRKSIGVILQDQINNEKTPHVRWWIYFSRKDYELGKQDEEERKTQRNSEEKKAYVELVNIFVGPYQNFVPLQGYHRSPIASWIKSLLTEKDFVKWVIDRGCILHPELHHYLLKDSSTTDLDDENISKFWDFILYERERLYVHPLERLGHYVIYPKGGTEETQLLWIKRELKVYVQIEEIHFTNEEANEFSVHPTYHFLNPRDAIRSHTNKILGFIENTQDEKILISAFHFCNAELLKIFEIEEYWKGDVNEENNYDISCGALPSLVEHEQNKHRASWGYLIQCLVKTCDRLASIAPTKLKSLSLLCFAYCERFPFYRRLILHAFRYDNIYSEDEIKKETLPNIQIYLWNTNLDREWFRFLDERWGKFSKDFRDEILRAICNGNQKENKKKYKDIASYLHLSWLQEKKWLNDSAQDKYNALQKEYPDFTPLTGEKAEFDTFHTSWTGPAYTEIDANHIFKKKNFGNILSELEKTYLNLQEQREQARLGSERILGFSSLTEENLGYCLNFYQELTRWNGNNDKKKKYFYDFFRGICYKKEIIEKKHEGILSTIGNLSQNYIANSIYSITNITRDIHELKFYSIEKDFPLWKKLHKCVLAGQEQREIDLSDLMSQSLNSPIGKLYEMALQEIFWKERKLEGGIPNYVKEAWQKANELPEKLQELAIVRFGLHLISLYELESQWTVTHIIAQMGKNDNFALSLWGGYFNFPQYSLQFFNEIKQKLFKVIKPLPNSSRSKAIELISHASVFHPDWVSKEEYQSLLSVLDRQELAGIMWNISALFERTEEDKKKDFWQKKLRPWIQDYWPRIDKYKSDNINEEWVKILFSIKQPTEEDCDLIRGLLCLFSNASIHNFHLANTLDKFEEEKNMVKAKEQVRGFLAILEKLFQGSQLDEGTNKRLKTIKGRIKGGNGGG